MIRSVVFDVGETLLDDTSEWGRWADWIGVPRHTFSAVMGAVVVGGRDNGETFQYFRPGFDIPGGTAAPGGRRVRRADQRERPLPGRAPGPGGPAGSRLLGRGLGQPVGPVR